MIRPYLYKHALIAAGITVGLGIPMNPVRSASIAVGFYIGREIAQFFVKKQELSLEVIYQHLIDVLAAVAGAVPAAILLNLLGF